MSNLLVNTQDQQFVLFEELGIEKLLESEPFKDFSKDDLLMRMNEAEKLEAIYETKGVNSQGQKITTQKEDQDAAFYSGMITSAKYFANEILTTVKARCEAVKAGDKTPLEMIETSFAY